MHALSVLLVRGLALFQFLQIWPSIWLSISAIHFDAPGHVKYFYYSVPILYTALSIFLWLAAPWIARKMLKGSDTSETKIPVSFDDAFIIATVSVGLLILARTIPLIGRFAYSLSSLAETAQGEHPVHWQGDGLEAPLYLILGLLLIFTPTGLLNLIRRSRKLSSSE